MLLKTKINITKTSKLLNFQKPAKQIKPTPQTNTQTQQTTINNKQQTKHTTSHKQNKNKQTTTNTTHN